MSTTEIAIRLPALPPGVAVPDSAEELLAEWGIHDGDATLHLYTGRGGPILDEEHGWAPRGPHRNWRGKLREGSVLLQSDPIRVPRMAGESTTHTLAWHADRHVRNDHWCLLEQPGGPWDGIACRLHPGGHRMRPGDTLLYTVSFHAY